MLLIVRTKFGIDDSFYAMISFPVFADVCMGCGRFYISHHGATLWQVYIGDILADPLPFIREIDVSVCFFCALINYILVEKVAFAPLSGHFYISLVSSKLDSLSLPESVILSVMEPAGILPFTEDIKTISTNYIFIFLYLLISIFSISIRNLRINCQFFVGFAHSSLQLIQALPIENRTIFC